MVLVGSRFNSRKRKPTNIKQPWRWMQLCKDTVYAYSSFEMGCALSLDDPDTASVQSVIRQAVQKMGMGMPLARLVGVGSMPNRVDPQSRRSQLKWTKAEQELVLKVRAFPTPHQPLTSTALAWLFSQWGGRDRLSIRDLLVQRGGSQNKKLNKKTKLSLPKLAEQLNVGRTGFQILTRRDIQNAAFAGYK
jgi:hypothetical protein